MHALLFRWLLLQICIALTARESLRILHLPLIHGQLLVTTCYLKAAALLQGNNSLNAVNPLMPAVRFLLRTPHNLYNSAVALGAPLQADYSLAVDLRLIHSLRINFTHLLPRAELSRRHGGQKTADLLLGLALVRGRPRRGEGGQLGLEVARKVEAVCGLALVHGGGCWIACRKNLLQRQRVVRGRTLHAGLEGPARTLLQGLRGTALDGPGLGFGFHLNTHFRLFEFWCSGVGLGEDGEQVCYFYFWPF